MKIPTHCVPASKMTISLLSRFCWQFYFQSLNPCNFFLAQKQFYQAIRIEILAHPVEYIPKARKVRKAKETSTIIKSQLKFEQYIMISLEKRYLDQIERGTGTPLHSCWVCLLSVWWWNTYVWNLCMNYARQVVYVCYWCLSTRILYYIQCKDLSRGIKLHNCHLKSSAFRLLIL